MQSFHQITESIKDSIKTKELILGDDYLEDIHEMSSIISQSISQGGKLLLCGNGGSAADAQHLAAELLIRLRPTVNRDPLPAIALAMDSSTFTACGNDFSFDDIFSRVVRAIGNSGDVLLGITTSGNSANVNKAITEANKIGVKTLALLGGSGGDTKDICDHSIIIPSTVTARIQESHILVGHIIMELIEDQLIESGFIKTE
ncbi:SIS domain-containing protein [Gammaproteobacteria bacterium]|nr:SIS domain-containing protein [Gammaproteobacteria bacterium]